MKNTNFNIKQLGKKEIPIAIYCGPLCASEYKGNKYESQMTRDIFAKLKECGINVVYGHDDEFNTPTEEEAIKCMDLCAEFGMAYLARDDISLDYCSTGRSRADYRTFSEEKKAEIDRRYEESLKKYCNHPAFAGVCFVDEPGMESFVGMKRAKDIFDRVCGKDKLFYVNLFPYYATAKQFDYGWELPDAPSTEGLEPYVNTNMSRYKVYVNRLLDVLNPQMISYDAYPYINLGGIESMHHIIMYDVPQYLHSIDKQRQIPYWVFLQGFGECGENGKVRVVNFAEVQLSISLALAFGAKGLQIFPGCYSKWLFVHDKEFRDEDYYQINAIIDKFGNTTEFFGYFKYGFSQVKSIQEYIAEAELICQIVSGEFDGMLPSEEVLQTVKDNDCIYRGKLPKEFNIETDSYKELIKVDATNQVIVSCFEGENGREFLIVNNSIITATTFTLTFDKEYDVEYIRNTRKNFRHGNKVTIQALAAGENVLLHLYKK